MFDRAEPSHLDYQLPANAYYHLIRTLRLTLPPPPGPDPGAEDLLKRDHAAMAAIAGLAPGNAAEARLAAQFVAASEQWLDCLRLARAPDTTPEWAHKYRAQAARMMRESNSAMRLLLQTQEARRKLEADNAACDRLGWTEHVATALMAEALPGHPARSGDVANSPPAAPLQSESAPAKAGDSAVVETRMPPRTPQQKPEPVPEPGPAPVAEPEPDLACPGPRSGVAAAEEYAVIYPERAALIRRAGRLPDDVSFGPPDDDLVQALITAHTPALVALDRDFAQACPVPRHGARAA